MNYVIIGNSAAAVGAVEAIRSVDKRNPLTIISDEPYHTYSRPLISYFLAGKVTEDRMLYRPRDFYQKNKVGLILGKRAVSLDTQGCKVYLEDGETVAYDRLLLATGGKPFIPRTEGLDKESIFTFSSWDDVRNIKANLRENTKAVVVGGGLTGLKAAESLKVLGVEVTVVELADRVLSTILDSQAASLIQKVLDQAGIKFYFGTTVAEVLGKDRVSGILLQDGTQLECDILIFSIGVTPNIDLVRDTLVETGKGIIVDKHMRTSVNGIYGAGDAAEGYDFLFGKNRVVATLPNAYKQGETAGFNMAGVPMAYAGSFPFNSVSLFGFPIITAGLQQAEGNVDEYIEINREQGTYRKILVKNNNVVGFIFLNEVDRAGIFTGVIRDGLDVGDFKNSIAQMEEFGYVCLPKQMRKERLFGGGQGEHNNRR